MSDYLANKSKVYGSTELVINALGLDTQGEIVQIENLTGSVFNWLDRYCGIDWIIKTKDLYDFTEKYDFLVSKDRKDNQFAVVKWSDLVRTGYKVFIKENYGY